MELTAGTYAFEALQIETLSLFLVIVTMAVYTWRSYSAQKVDLQNPGLLAAIFGAAFTFLAVAFVLSLGGTLFLLAVELALGVLLSVMRPMNALSLFICLQFLRPWEVYEGNALLLALPRLTGLLALGTAGVAFMRNGLNKFRLGVAQWALVGFAAWALATTLFTPAPFDLQSMYFDGFFRALIVFFLITLVVREENDLDLVRRVYLASVSGLASVSIYLSWDDIFGREGMAGGERLHSVGSLENANDIAAVMVIGIPFALRHLADNPRKPAAWVESGFFLGITLLALYLAQSRGALVALGAGGLGWWLLRSKRKLFVVLTGVAVVGVVAPFANEFLRRDAGDLQESGASRITYWKAGLRMAVRSPIVGVGFGMYPKEYQANAGGGEQYEFGERTAHSTWILALAETGVPGFTFFVVFVLSVLRMARRVVRHEPDLFVAAIAYLIAVSFLSHTYVIYLYILAGLIVAAFRMRFRSAKGWAM